MMPGPDVYAARKRLLALAADLHGKRDEKAARLEERVAAQDDAHELLHALAGLGAEAVVAYKPVHHVRFDIVGAAA